MKCYICDADKWKNITYQVDGKSVPIHSKKNLHICQECGAAGHEVDPSEEARVKEYYRKDYRPQPALINLITTTHKVNYIRVLLQDFLREKQGTQMNVGDVGAATGYLLNFFRQLGHKVAGSELTLTYRRMSEHYYGIPLAEELETKHKYDLIVMYHVLEHLVEPDKKMAHYASLLNDGGHMLIATPEWFWKLEDDSGQSTVSFDVLFHENHINLFSRTAIQNLFRKSGMSVVKDDYQQYGQTYLLRKDSEPRKGEWLTKEDPREIERIMLLQRNAIDLFVAQRFREARRAYPNFPEAWLLEIFLKCGKDLAKQTDLIAEAEPIVGHSIRFMTAKAQWLYQQGRLDEAIEGYRRGLSIRPNEDVLMFLGYALAQKNKPIEAIQAMQMAQAMDPRKWAEAQSWILAQVSRMPSWDERAAAELKSSGLVATPAMGVAQ